MSNELYKRLRPKKLEDVVGQDGIIKSIGRMIEKEKIPHSILLSGPSGCGKTTLARIIARKAGCRKHDLAEINCADFRGIDMVRDIRSRMNQMPISGKSRGWIIDEAHKLSNDAQNAILKILEDTPNHVYFFLCTTESQKLLKTIRTRCTEFSVKSLTDKAMESLLTDMSKKENIKVSKEVVTKVVENSEGSARRGLVLLDQIMSMDSEKEMLATIESASIETQAIEIARALINPKTNWAKMAGILKQADIEDAEGIRWMVMGYAKSVLLSGRGPLGRAFLILDSFRDHFYDSKSNGLVAACYQVICGD